ncbi:hypothetical protein NHJ13051_002931 [Beauveria bassiana]
MIAATVLTSIGGGLSTLLDPSVSSAVLIGFQALVDFGIGVGWQQPIVAVQAAVDMKDVPITTAIISFAQTTGGSLFVIVAQTAFSNKLVQNIHATLPDMDPATIMANGAAGLASHVPNFYRGYSYGDVVDCGRVCRRVEDNQERQTGQKGAETEATAMVDDAVGIGLV